MYSNIYQKTPKLSPASIQLVPSNGRKVCTTFCKLMFTFSRACTCRASAQCWPAPPTHTGLLAPPAACQSTWTVFAAQATRETLPARKLNRVQQEEPVYKDQRAGFCSYTVILSDLSEATYRKYFKYWKKKDCS